MPRKLLPLAALLLCSTALAGCQTMASLNPFGGDSAVAYKAKVQANVDEQIALAPPSDIAGGVAQARALRLAGKYDDASRVLSQLMLVASDDPRVVGEYGKTLLERGQTPDAVQFLSRAVQLQSGDWTTYSALGVSYDQLGNPAQAKIAYEHALALNPSEASVLSNYALSRVIANDVSGARVLAARAESAGGASDPKIARNISMIMALAAAQPQTPVAAAAPPAPTPVASAAPAQPAPAAAPKVVASASPVNRPSPDLRPATVEAAAAPRLLMPAPAYTPPPGAQPLTGAVSQALPVPAAPVKAVAFARVWVTPNRFNHAAPGAVAKADKPVAGKSVFIPVKAADASPFKPVAVSLPVKAAAVAPVAEKTPAPVKAATVTPAVAKPVPVKAAAVQAVPAKAAAVTPVVAKPVPVKTAAAQPTPAVPAVKTPAPVKAATATPAVANPAPVKTAAAKPSGVPALRLASDASSP